ncbi:MAG TPA: alpha-E domain-containing protein, partial [bacterium]
FGQLGRTCERADQTSRLVDVNHRLLEGKGWDADHPTRWEAVLKSASALQMYRRRHGATEGSRVAEFLLLDETFPRSLAFCLNQAEEALRALTGTPSGGFKNDAEKALGKLASEVRYTEFKDVRAPGVHGWLDNFQSRLNEVGLEIQREYFESVSVPSGAGREMEQQQQQ